MSGFELFREDVERSGSPVTWATVDAALLHQGVVPTLGQGRRALARLRSNEARSRVDDEAKAAALVAELKGV